MLFLGKALNKSLVVSSIMQDDFVACYGTIVQVVWMRNFISGLRVVDSIFYIDQIILKNCENILLKNNKRLSIFQIYGYLVLKVKDKPK
jgi:hypothetical protein